jgi:hypothetical protein
LTTIKPDVGICLSLRCPNLSKILLNASGTPVFDGIRLLWRRGGLLHL